MFMLRKLLTSLAAAAIFATSFAPVEADARDRRGYYDRDHRDRDYDRRGRHHRDRDDDGDAIAAGVVGLVLGLAIGSIANSQQRDQGCRQNCGGETPRYYRDEGAYQDDPRYGDSAYSREYGGLAGGDDYYEEAPQCTRRERQWDRYANRYVTVDVPC